MYLSTPVLLIRRGVLLVDAFRGVVYEKISFTSGIRNVYGVSVIVSFVGGFKTETFLIGRPLNNCWSKILLLV